MCAADFGVSAELVQTMAKRATMIGSPYCKRSSFPHPCTPRLRQTLTPRALCVMWWKGMAPEILKQMKYDPKVDVWSLGVTAYELVTSRPPYSELPYMKVSRL